MSPPLECSKEDSTYELATSPTGSYCTSRLDNFPYLSTQTSKCYVMDFQNHVDPCNQIFDRGVLISKMSPQESQRVEWRSNIFHSNFTNSTRLIYDPVPSPNTVHGSRKYEETTAIQSPKNSKFAGKINRMAIEFQLTNDISDATSSRAQSLHQGVNKLEEVNDKTAAPNTNTKDLLHLSAYIPGEYVHYDDFENHVNQESKESVKTLATHQGVNEVDESQCSLLEVAQTAKLSPNNEDVKLLELTSFKEPPIAPVITAKENARTSDLLDAPFPKRIRRAFKKILPTENVEQFLRNPETLSYDELYHKTATIASLMGELQDEARVIDKELNDFEVARKSNLQISIEEAKLEKESKQKEEDIIFEGLLKKYGNLTKLSVDDWTCFLKNFYDNHLDENPENYRLLLQLRNHQFIQDFQKRKNCKDKAKQKANTIKLADTFDSPPTKMEQKAMEESDRRKRKPAIDPLIFEDRKMADVYGMIHKNGDAFIGNQPLKDRNGITKDLCTTKNNDDNFRPKRARGRRGNNDTDHSDHTPVVSDAEDIVPSKRARISRAGADSAASSRTGVKTAPSSRESSPGAGPKIFASGKRVGRPPGSSKAQVKLPSKLKSVQAIGEITQTNLSGEPKDIARIEDSNLIRKLYVDKNPYVIYCNNENSNTRAEEAYGDTFLSALQSANNAAEAFSIDNAGANGSLPQSSSLEPPDYDSDPEAYCTKCRHRYKNKDCFKQHLKLAPKRKNGGKQKKCIMDFPDQFPRTPGLPSSSDQPAAQNARPSSSTSQAPSSIRGPTERIIQVEHQDDPQGIYNVSAPQTSRSVPPRPQLFRDEAFPDAIQMPPLATPEQEI
ncbi:hypothetical protein EPUL_003926 [Erysiphe pulchra]|uniref:Uncharacterized protein n=1 Tax=Erysiphe pulchra TaxID=225359 RepID=A0A2S4PMH5_9PEZI|nr:hypothetical protein EPUL_003926 [Erysiphe pulchra]